MIDRDKLDKLFAALEVVRDALPEVAIIFPATAVVDGLIVAAIPMVENGLGLIFEAASLAQSYPNEEGARAAMAASMQQKAQAALDAKFPNG